ncbi:purine/pyrimidine permease [Camelliibacillus cellulosilyticus]|uniref:Purine/pyrimidine permease n=1 Tax=Camelliibacillus cellulosilyticus TaxID=2174486 RepID=A0ABV9GPU6_9BACL
MGKLVLSSFQWMVFILAGTIVAPVSVAYAFGFSAADTATLLQRAFFVVGLTSMLQGVFGHKLPLMEGPAGLWWGVFLAYASLVSKSGAEGHAILSSLELGLMASGALFLFLSAFNLIRFVQKLFSPAVTGIYLILLIIQLSGPFIQGILGAESGSMDGLTAILAIITLILSVILSQSKRAFFKNYSVLISLIIGWVLFIAFGKADFAMPGGASVVRFPQWLAWGAPSFNLGVFITSLLTALLLLTNLMASVDAVKQVVKPKKQENMRLTNAIMGINQIFAGLFPTVGCVPISGSAGFILTTRIKERLPFLIGSALILMLSFFPAVTDLFSDLPAPVGYATLFVSMASILGLGIKTVKNEISNEKKATVISLSIMVGAGILLLPQSALSHLPSVVASILHNGLIVGVVIAMVLDQILARPSKQSIKLARAGENNKK